MSRFYMPHFATKKVTFHKRISRTKKYIYIHILCFYSSDSHQTLLKVRLSQRSLMLRVRILPLSPSTSLHACVNSASDNFLPSDCEDNQTILHMMLVNFAFHFSSLQARATRSFKSCAARHGVYK